MKRTKAQLTPILEHGAAFALALVPLVMWPTLRPAVIPRAVLAEAFALLIGGMVLLLARPLRLSLPGTFLLAFLAWGLVAVLRSDVPAIALEGGFQRLWGWRAWATLAVWFFGLRHGFRWFRPRRIFLGLEITALLLAVYALLQWLKLDPLPWASLYGDRVHATLDNPNTLAILLAMATPFFLLRLFSGSRNALVASIAALVLVFLALWASGSRGGFLAAVAALGLTGLLLALPRRPASAVGWAGLLLIAAWASPWYPYGPRPTGEARQVIWCAAAQGVAERPIWGHGFDLLTPFFDRTLPPYLVYLQGDVRVDRAHNGVLDLAMSAGIPGVLLYAGLLVALYWAAWRCLSQEDHPLRAVTAAVAGSCLAFHIGMVLNFVTLSLGWVIFALWAYLAALAEKRTVRTALVPSWARWAAAVVLLVTWGALNVPRWQADRLAYRATRQYPFAVAPLEEAVCLRPQRAKYHELLGQALWQVGDLQAAEEAFLRAVQANPADFGCRAKAGRFYLLAGRAGDADTWYRQALAMAPQNAHLWKEWGDVAFAQDEQEAAMERYQRAVGFNDTLASAHLGLGYVYLRADQQEAAYRCFDRVNELDPSLIADLPDVQRILNDHQP